MPPTLRRELERTDQESLCALKDLGHKVGIDYLRCGIYDLRCGIYLYERVTFVSVDTDTGWFKLEPLPAPSWTGVLFLSFFPTDIWLSFFLFNLGLKAESDANPIPSFRYWSGRKKQKNHSCRSKEASCAEMVLLSGHLFAFV